MKRTRIARVISLLAVVAMLVAYTPAFAETVYATGIVTTNTDLYQTASGTTGSTVLCTINSGSSVSIHSMTSSGAFYRVTVTTSSASYTGYVAYADVRLSTSAGTTSSPTVAYYDANGNPVYSYSGSTTTSSASSSTGTQTEYYINGVRYSGTAEGTGTTTTGTTGTTGTSGTTSTTGTTATVVNCDEWVSLRPTASSSMNRLAKVPKGTTVTVNGTSSSGNYTYVTVNGQTGYILSSYLSTGSTGSTGTTVTAGATSATYATQVLNNYTNASLKYNDCVGYIMVPGTNISHPIMFSSSLYYDTHTPDGAKSSAASIYAYSNTLMNVTVVAGHNLRVSKTMFHALHDVQNALLSGSSSANSTFYIKMGGYTTWQLFSMYETKATEPTSTLTYNTMNAMSLSGSALDTWIKYQTDHSQVNFSTTASSADAGKLMVLVTCGDNYDSSTAQSRLYMFLKAVA